MPRFRGRGPHIVERIVRWPSHVLGSAVFDLQVTGKEHIPATGGVVIASNHFSHLDVPLLATNLDRYVRFLAVDELFGNSKLFDATLNFFQAIPIDRDGYPIRALRTAIEYLQNGELIGLFPEGRRVEQWGVDKPKRGAAWLAWKTGAPLVPVAIQGTQHALSPASKGMQRTAVRIWVEEPLMWDDYVDYADPLSSMMADWYERVNKHLEPWSTRES